MLPRLMVAGLALLLSAGNAFAADEKLLGDWVGVAIEAGGMKIEGEDAKKLGMSLTFKEKTVVSKSAGEEADEDEYTTGKEGDVLTLDVKDKKGLVKGIYKIEDGKLVIALGGPGEERPKEFKTTADSKFGVVHLEKKK